MTNKEFSNEFDTLLNSFGDVQDPHIELTEYEKSVFLTKAQEDIVLASYKGINNNSFESTEELRRSLSSLVKTASSIEISPQTPISKHSSFFKLPSDLWFITYESVISEDPALGCLTTNELIVVPITQDDYFNISNNPFKRNNKKRVLRLDIGSNVVELVSKYKIKEYKVRYIAKPSPIILINLEQMGLTINSYSQEIECELSPVIHRAILDRAIILASMSRTKKVQEK